MSIISLDRFVSSVYNEKIKVNSEFDIDGILQTNKDDPVIPIDTLNKPPGDDVVDYFKYELNKYVKGNVKLVDKALLSESPPQHKDEKTKISLLKKYALRNLLIDKLFGTTLRKEIGVAKRTIYLFPTYDNETKGKDKLLDEISNNYEWIFDLPDFTTNPIRFYLNDKIDSGITKQTIQSSFNLSTNQFREINKQPFNHLLFPNNAIVFLPVINPTEDEVTFESRINGVIQQILQSIENEAKVMEGQFVSDEKIPFLHISYAVYDDKDNELFTDYYKDKLSSKKKKILKKILDDTFKRGAVIGKQTIQINNTKKVPFQLATVEQTEKDFLYFTRSIYSNLLNNDELLNLKDNLNKLINKFKDYSKRSENLEYSITASADTNTNFLRVFYRVNNMDVPVTVDLIRTGTNYLYKLQGIKLNRIDSIDSLAKSSSLFPNGLYVGFLFKNKISTSKNIYRFQVHLLKTQQIRKLTQPSIDITAVDDDETQTMTDTDSKSTMIQIMKNDLTGEITYQLSGSRDNLKGFGLNFKGQITEYENLHIYEKYRWFRFNHIDGSLPDETNIRFFPDILFDRKSFIEFLKSKNAYDEKKTRIPYEFLKINKDITQLLEYTDFLQDKYSSTHIYKPSLLGRFTKASVEEIAFENSIKSGLLEIIFTPINVIYVGKPPTTTKSLDDKDTSKNYKIVSYQEYKPSGFRTALNTTNVKYQYGSFYKHNLEQVLSGEDEEYKYCDKHKLEKCEIMKEFFTPSYLKHLENKKELLVLEEQLKVLTESTETNKKDDKQLKIESIKTKFQQKQAEIKEYEESSEKKEMFIEENKESKDTKKFINNRNQHISMSIVTVTQEDINPENFKNFLTKNKCKTIRKQLKRDLKGIRADIFKPIHSAISSTTAVFGGKKNKQTKQTNQTKQKNNKTIKLIKLNKMIKGNRKIDVFVKKVKKNKKIKPFRYTKKNKK
jgi:hypothetical protein